MSEHSKRSSELGATSPQRQLCFMKIHSFLSKYPYILRQKCLKNIKIHWKHVETSENYENIGRSSWAGKVVRCSGSPNAPKIRCKPFQTAQRQPTGHHTCPLHSGPKKKNFGKSYLIPPWRFQVLPVSGICPMPQVPMHWSLCDEVKLLRPSGRRKCAIGALGHCHTTQYTSPVDSTQHCGTIMAQSASLWFFLFFLRFENLAYPGGSRILNPLTSGHSCSKQMIPACFPGDLWWEKHSNLS